MNFHDQQGVQKQ